MALIKSNVFLFTSLLILVALFGVIVGGTVHKVGDAKGWTMMGVDYEAWASSRTFQVGDSLVFEYNNDFHDVTEIALNDFELCDPSKPLARYQTGSDTFTLTKPGFHHFICGVPGHCDMGQNLQILVLPTSLGPVAARVPGPVRSPSSSSSPALANSKYVPFIFIHHHGNDAMGPSPSYNAASVVSKSVWKGSTFLPLLCLLILL